MQDPTINPAEVLGVAIILVGIAASFAAYVLTVALRGGQAEELDDVNEPYECADVVPITSGRRTPAELDAAGAPLDWYELTDEQKQRRANVEGARAISAMLARIAAEKRDGAA